MCIGISLDEGNYFVFFFFGVWKQYNAVTVERWKGMSLSALLHHLLCYNSGDYSDPALDATPLTLCLVVSRGLLRYILLSLCFEISAFL